ncbi:MAG: hypothetical protein ABR572_06015 [Cryomorphaceae bacterium]|nr:hypothetical protein [Flavobacteriales bacterium]
MNEINIENYEAWLLDSLEGRLSADEQKALEAFLMAHPELDGALDGFEDVGLTPPDEGLTDRDNLKKSDKDARDLLCFKAAEGELTPAEAEEFERLSAKPEFRDEYNQWKRAKLAPEETAFEKDDLYCLGLDRPVSDFNFEYYTIAFAEGQLDEAGEKALMEYIGDDPERRRALAIAEGLKLQPAAGIFFPGKENLHRKERRGGLLLVLRAAAALLLLAAATFVYNTLLSPTGVNDLGIAETKKTTETTAPDEKDAEAAVLSDTTSVKAKPADEKSTPEKGDGDDNAEPAEPESIPEYMVREPDEPLMADGTAPAQESTEKALKEADVPEADTPKDPQDEGPADTPERMPSIESETELAELAAEPELMTPEIADPDLYIRSESSGKVPASENYLTLSELAKNTVAGRFDLDDSERDRMALAVAKRIADRAGEMLDAEVKKEVPDDGESLTYTVRIGNFKVSHSRQK